MFEIEIKPLDENDILGGAKKAFEVYALLSEADRIGCALVINDRKLLVSYYAGPSELAQAYADWVAAVPDEEFRRQRAYASLSRVIAKGRTFSAVDIATGQRLTYTVAEHANIGEGWLLFDPSGRMVSDQDIRDPVSEGDLPWP